MTTKIGKTAMPFLALMLAMAMIGTAYAMWSKTLYVYGYVDTGELDWEFIHPFTYTDHGLDWTSDDGLINVRQLDKDVGSTAYRFIDSDGDGDNDILEVTMKNVYPSYYEHMSFWVRNNGTIPLKIKKVIIDGQEFTAPFYVKLDLNGDGKDDVEIYYGDSFGVQLHPYPTIPYKADISFEIHVLQGAPQGETLSFTIEIVAVQWNEY